MVLRSLQHSSHIRRIADDVPIQVISKNPDWTMMAEDLNDRYPTTPIEQIVNELSNHDAIILGLQLVWKYGIA